MNEDVARPIINAYRDRFKAILDKIREQLIGDYIVDLPTECDDDDYRWMLLVKTHSEESSEPHEKDVDISVEMVEASSSGDDCFDEQGVTFRIDIVECSGLIIGGLCPFNYSENCWVDGRDMSQVEERFKLLEQANFSSIPALVSAPR